jgi:sarcosine oxidase subunit beta
LRQQQGLSVTLLERELVGRQASGTNFGNVRRQGRALAQMPLANRARAVWGRVKELLGEDLEFVPYGHLRVCYNETQAATLEQHARDVKPLGLDLELFNAEQLRKRWGIFAPEVVSGSLSPNDGHANPRLAGPAFARAARRAGADIVEHAEVMQVEHDGAGFVAHTADGRRFSAPQLLVACGAWSNRMAAQFGEAVPMEARGPQMGVTEPLPYAIGPSIGLSSPIEHEGLYFRQIARGNIVFGGGLKGPAHADSVRAYVKPDNVLRQLRELRRFVPAFEHVQLIRVWSGIEGYTADWQPVMGPSARAGVALRLRLQRRRLRDQPRRGRDDGRADRHRSDFDADRGLLDRPLRARAGEAGCLKRGPNPGFRCCGTIHWWKFAITHFSLFSVHGSASTRRCFL